MYRREKVDYGKYLNPASIKNKKDWKAILKIAWVWTKVFLFVFMITSLLWGCVLMFQPKYAFATVTDMTGRSNFFNTGVGFEIILKSLGDSNYSKTFWFLNNGGYIESYQYTTISSWSEAFTVTGSPYYGFFVYPISWFLVFCIKLMNGWSLNTSSGIYGFASIMGILITCLVIKSGVLGMTWKTIVNQDKMQKIQGEQAKIKAKYGSDPSREAKQRMQMEIMRMQKKEGVNMFDTIATMFLSAPILFSMYTAIRNTHELKVSKAGSVYLTDVIWQMLSSGHWVFISFFLVYFPLQAISVFLPIIIQVIEARKKYEAPEVKKQRKRSMLISGAMSLAFIFVVGQIPAGVCIYWIFQSTFQISQTLLIHYLRKSKPKRIARRRDRNKIKNEKKQLIAKQKNQKNIVQK